MGFKASARVEAWPLRTTVGGLGCRAGLKLCALKLLGFRDAGKDQSSGLNIARELWIKYLRIWELFLSKGSSGLRKKNMELQAKDLWIVAQNSGLQATKMPLRVGVVSCKFVQERAASTPPHNIEPQTAEPPPQVDPKPEIFTESRPRPKPFNETTTAIYFLLAGGGGEARGEGGGGGEEGGGRGEEGGGGGGGGGEYKGIPKS